MAHNDGSLSITSARAMDGYKSAENTRTPMAAGTWLARSLIAFSGPASSGIALS